MFDSSTLNPARLTPICSFMYIPDDPTAWEEEPGETPAQARDREVVNEPPLP
jgi:hypothetical protein